MNGDIDTCHFIYQGCNKTVNKNLGQISKKE